MESAPQRGNPGDPITASKWNALVDAIGVPNITTGAGIEGNNFGSGVRVSLSKQPEEYWTGKVVAAGPDGQADFTSNRYWIQRQQVSTVNSTTSCLLPCNPQQIVKWTAASAPFAQTVTATNRTEALSGTHFVPVGSIVRVYEEYDNGSPAALRYSFDATPPAFVGKIVSAGPCGEADFTNNRYWVHRESITSGGYTTIIDSSGVSDVTDPFNACDSANPCSPDSSCTPKEDGRHSIVVVTNFAEQPNGSHLIDVGSVIEVWWGTDGGGQPRYWTQYTPLLRVGTYCPEDSLATMLSNDSKNIQKLSFEKDSFVLTAASGDSSRMEIDWRGFMVFVPAYTGDPTKSCHSQQLKLIDARTNPDGAAPSSFTRVNPSSTGTDYDQFNVYWTLTNESVADPCQDCSDPTTKPTAKVSANVYIDPCKYLPNVDDCPDGTGPWTCIKSFNFGRGLIVDGSTGGSVTVTLGLTVDTGSAYLTLDNNSSDCGQTLNLCTRTVTPVAQTVVTGCDSMGNQTTTTIYVLPDATALVVLNTGCGSGGG